MEDEELYPFFKFPPSLISPVSALPLQALPYGKIPSAPQAIGVLRQPAFSGMLLFLLLSCSTGVEHPELYEWTYSS